MEAGMSEWQLEGLDGGCNDWVMIGMAEPAVKMTAVEAGILDSG